MESSGSNVTQSSEVQVEATESQFIIPKRFIGRLTRGTSAPDVRNVEHWRADNVAPQNVTSFTNGQPGQHLYILGDGFTTIIHTVGVIENVDEANKLLALGKVTTYLMYDNGIWHEQAGGGIGPAGPPGPPLPEAPTFGDLAILYPTPALGDKVLVLDTDILYRWNGTAWEETLKSGAPGAPGEDGPPVPSAADTAAMIAMAAPNLQVLNVGRRQYAKFDSNGIGFRYYTDAPTEEINVESFGVFKAPTGTNPAGFSDQGFAAACLSVFNFEHEGRVQTHVNGDGFSTLTALEQATGLLPVWTNDEWIPGAFSGSVTAVGTDTISDSTQNFFQGDFRGSILRFTSGARNGKSYVVHLLTGDSTQLRFRDVWGASPPAIGDTYVITHVRLSTPYFNFAYEVATVEGTGRGQWANIVGNTGTQLILDRELSFALDGTTRFRILVSRHVLPRQATKSLVIPNGDYKFDLSFGPVLQDLEGSIGVVVDAKGWGSTRLLFSQPTKVTETTLTGATATTITKTGAGWTIDEWVGRYVYVWCLVDSPFFHDIPFQQRKVISNTIDTLVLDKPLTTIPDPGVNDTFAVGDRTCVALNGMAHHQIQGFEVFVNKGEGGEFRHLIELTWIANYSGTDSYNSDPHRVSRSSTQNVFDCVACEGRWIDSGIQIGNMAEYGGANLQVDNTKWYDCRATGGFERESLLNGGVGAARASKTHWRRGVRAGGFTYGNCVIHDFYNFISFGVYVGGEPAYSDMAMYSPIIESVYAAFNFAGSPHFFSVHNMRLELAGYFLLSRFTIGAKVRAKISNIDFLLSEYYDPDNIGRIIEFRHPGTIDIDSFTTTPMGPTGKRARFFLEAEGKLSAITSIEKSPWEGIEAATSCDVSAWTVIDDWGIPRGGYAHAIVTRDNLWIGAPFGPQFSSPSGTKYSVGGDAFNGDIESGQSAPEVYRRALGELGVKGSVQVYGESVKISRIPDPSAPQLKKGSSGSASYTYRLVYRDALGRRSAVSAPATIIDAPDALAGSQGGENKIFIYPADRPHGVVSIDILKGDDITALATHVPVELFPFRDYGQATAAYVPPTVNETGGAFSSEPLTFASGDATPSVALSNIWKCANSAATTITNFDVGVEGQHIHVLSDANTTIQNNANIVTKSGSDLVGVGLRSFVRVDNVWYEV